MTDDEILQEMLADRAADQAMIEQAIAAILPNLPKAPDLPLWKIFLAIDAVRLVAALHCTELWPNGSMQGQWICFPRKVIEHEIRNVAQIKDAGPILDWIYSAATIFPRLFYQLEAREKIGVIKLIELEKHESPEEWCEVLHAFGN